VTAAWHGFTGWRVLQMWEMGIDLCKELSGQYETETFDYIRLSSILVRHHFNVDLVTNY